MWYVNPGTDTFIEGYLRRKGMVLLGIVDVDLRTGGRQKMLKYSQNPFEHLHYRNTRIALTKFEVYSQADPQAKLILRHSNPEQ